MQRSLAGCLTLAALAAVLPSGAHAQAPAARTANNTVFLELGGNALIYSVNYERVTPSNVALRAGLGYMSLSAAAGGASANVSYVGIPVTISYLGLGGGSARFELGGGAAFHRFSGASSTGFGDELEADVFVPVATLIAGLRIAPPGGGFNFKLAFTPSWHPDMDFFPWGGLAFGYGF